MSIKVKLVVLFTSLIMFIAVGLGGLSIWNSSNTIELEAESNITSIAYESAKLIDATIKQETSFLSAIAENSVITDEENRQAYFNELAKKYNYVDFSFVRSSGQVESLTTNSVWSNVSGEGFLKDL
ncbi:hypothetical protein [Bacillus sp. JCM 19034]|uniref:hypothetical protein n=1 Tax=Bacillus sp. JCM 19034 TaxID=1481928 RepID=UPI0007817C8A|nr:hypothetical protein [Bacillus sp. JCM 19034]